jgi:hypothetical protein
LPLVALLAALAGGVAARPVSAGTLPSPAWTTFEYNAQRSGVGPTDVGIRAANLRSLRRIVVRLPGTVDSSAVALANVRVRGANR